MEVIADADKPPKKKWVYNPGGKCECSCDTGDKCKVKKGVRYLQPEIPASFKPKLVYAGNTTPVSTDTIYKNSYMKFDPNAIRNSKGKPCLPKGTIVSAGDFSSDTTNKMSYGEWKGYHRQPKIYPRDHCLMGEGPLQDMTTTRHDYMPKPIDIVDKVKQPGCLGLSTKPMETRTTNSLSYLWPREHESAVPFKPDSRYRKPDNKMCGDTVQKLSFKPFELQKKEVFPWQKKPTYTSPRAKMCTETIYADSFFPPGQFVEDNACSGCYCIRDGECCDTQDKPPNHESRICPAGYDPIRDGPRLQTANS